MRRFDALSGDFTALLSEAQNTRFTVRVEILAHDFNNCNTLFQDCRSSQILQRSVSGYIYLPQSGLKHPGVMSGSESSRDSKVSVDPERTRAKELYDGCMDKVANIGVLE